MPEPADAVSALMLAVGADTSTGVTADEVFATGLITIEQCRALNQRSKDDDLKTKSLRNEFERRRAVALYADLTAICHLQGCE